MLSNAIVLRSPFSLSLDTNYSPSPSEIMEIDGWIGHYQFTVDVLNEELTELDLRRKQLEDIIDTHRDLIKQHRNLSSAIRRIPSDVLSIIFSTLLLLSDPAASPCPAVIVSHVCRYWRDVSLGTAMLWTNLRISIPTYPLPISIDQVPVPLQYLSLDDRYHYAKNLSRWRKQARATYDEVKVLITRSAECPIRLSLTACDPICPADVSEDTLTEQYILDCACMVEATIGALKGTEYRWRNLRLVLKINRSSVFLRSYMKLVEMVPKGVQSIELDLEYNGGNPNHLSALSWQQVLRNKVMVKSATPSMVLRATSVDMRGIHPRWAQISDLTIGFKEANVLAQDVFIVLRRTPGLTRLSIEFSGKVIVGQNPEIPVRLHRLRRLEIRGICVPQEFGAPFELPSLSELVFYYPDTIPYQHSALIEWVKRYGIQLTHASLNYTCLNPTTLQWVLACLPKVVSLELFGTVPKCLETDIPFERRRYFASIDSSFLEELTPPIHMMSRLPCYCTKLEKLVIFLEVGHGPGVQQSVVNLIEARRKWTPENGSQVSWLEEVVIGFDEGEVDHLLKALRFRGIDISNVKLIAQSS